VQKGYIYKGTHEGWYAVSDEAFYTTKEVEEVTDPSTGTVSHVSGLESFDLPITEALYRGQLKPGKM
jgi:hypothetical protein